MNKAEIIYLDSNVLIALSDRRIEKQCLAFESSVESGRYVYPFTSEHIDELTTFPLSDRTAQRLAYLGRLSKTLHLHSSVTEFGWMFCAPQEVYETINEAKAPVPLHSVINEILPYAQRRTGPNLLGLSPNELNNLSGKEALTEIDKAIQKMVPDDGMAPRSVWELMERVREFTPLRPRGFGSPSRERVLADEWAHQIGSLFVMFDSFGLWPDDERSTLRGSGMVDALHVFSASHCSALVSEDQKMRGKAEAVYEVLGIKTEVLSVAEFFERL